MQVKEEGLRCEGLIHVDETMIDGVEDEFQAVGDPQPVKYAGQVMLNGVLTYVQLSR